MAAVAQVSLNFLSRSSHSAAQTLAAASPRILSATPKSLCGSPAGPSPRSFVAVATPKTPARSPFSSTPAAAGNGGASPFFGSASPVWSDFEMAARASAEASAQFARVALPSAISPRQHCLARMGRRGSSTKFDESSNENSNNNNNNTSNKDSFCMTSSDDLPSACGTVLGGLRQPRLGLGRRGDAVHTSGSGEFQGQPKLPVMLGSTRNQPTKVLRELYMEKEIEQSQVDDTAKAAALVRENFLRRRAMIAGRAALAASP